MASAIRKIKEIKPLDLIIEVIDARSIKSSRNDSLIAEINKPKITIAVKNDLVDEKTLKKDDNIFFCSTKNKNDRKKIINLIYKHFEQKIKTLKQKGLLIPQFYILVVGLPNIGKSSLINFITDYTTKTIVQNKAGTTKKNQLIKINENLFLYDTPGIMVKKIESDTQGYILSALNVIKKEVIPLEKVCEWIFNFYNLNYHIQFNEYFKIDKKNNFEDFIKHLCTKYNFYTNNSSYDKNRALDFFFNLIKDNKICKVNYDKE